jgi:hypothetical protein
MIGRDAAATVICLVLGCTAASAQTPPAAAPIVPQYEVSGGVLWGRGYGLGTATATLTAPTPGRLSLFDTDTNLAGAAGPAVRLGYRAFEEGRLEVGFAFARPVLTTEVRNDPEGAAAVSVTEKISEYLLDVSGAYEPSGFCFAEGRGRPFAALSIGHVRHRHEDGVVVETGWQIQLGVGLTYVLLTRDRGLFREFDARGDLRLAFRKGGVEFEENRRTLPSLALAIVGAF